MDPLRLLDIEPDSWLAYDLMGAIQRFGRGVESAIDDAVKAERKQHEEVSDAIRKSGGKPGKMDEQRLIDVAEEAWYLHVRGLVRVPIGVPAMRAGEEGDLSSLTRQRRAFLIKPATFDPAIDADMDTDDVRMVYED